MRKTLLGAALLVLPLAACKKTGENEIQVQTPTVPQLNPYIGRPKSIW
jgi:hypothetical protein